MLCSRLFPRSLRTFATATGSPIIKKPSATGDANKASSTLTKFWESVSLNTNDKNELTVNLDNKPLRTPLGHTLTLPGTRRHLAHLIQHEWSSLPSLTIKTHSLPLTSLASRAIDLERAQGDNDAMIKVGDKRDIIEMLLRYLDTDTLLVFSPADEYDGALRKDQEKRYRPVMREVERLFGVQLTHLDSDKDGLRGNKQTEETLAKVREYLHSLNYFDLVAVEKVTLSAKSLICGILTVQLKSRDFTQLQDQYTLEDLAQLCTLEIIHQTEKWGEVEDTHDVDYQDIRRNINSAAILCFEERD